jgi:hypothetical protein
METKARGDLFPEGQKKSLIFVFEKFAGKGIKSSAPELTL